MELYNEIMLVISWELTASKVTHQLSYSHIWLSGSFIVFRFDHCMYPHDDGELNSYINYYYCDPEFPDNLLNNISREVDNAIIR